MTEADREFYKKQYGIHYIKTGEYKNYEIGYYVTPDKDDKGNNIVVPYKFKKDIGEFEYT